MVVPHHDLNSWIIWYYSCNGLLISGWIAIQGHLVPAGDKLALAMHLSSQDGLQLPAPGSVVPPMLTCNAPLISGWVAIGPAISSTAFINIFILYPIDPEDLINNSHVQSSFSSGSFNPHAPE
jgi:hypothetical protein